MFVIENYCSGDLQIFNHNNKQIILSLHKHYFIFYIFNNFNYKLHFPLGSQGVLMMAWCRSIIILTTRFFFFVAKHTTLTPLSLLTSWKLAFPAVSLKISSLSSALISPNRIFMWYLGLWCNTYSNSSSTVSFESSLLTRVGACTFREISLQQPVSTIYNILSLTHSTLLSVDTIL